jgi:replicative DNA helicase
MDISLEKTLPHNLEVEKIILGYILTSGQCNIELDTEDFYLDSHRKIWRCMAEMAQSGKGPDLISVIHELQRNNELEHCGGAAYLASLSDGIPNFHEGLADQYQDIIREQHALRIGVQVGMEIMSKCYDSQKFKDVVNDAFARLDIEIARVERNSGPKKLADIIGTTYSEIEMIASHHNKDGIRLGYPDLDAMIPRGLQTKEFFIIAGRPGSGKSSLMMNIAKKIALNGHVLLIFSLEMSSHQLVLRMIAEEARVSLSKMATGFINREEWDKIGRACGILSDLAIYIDDSTDITISDARSRIRRLRDRAKLVLFDYLQLMPVPKFLANRSDQEKVSYNSTGMKNMAKNLDICVGSAAQLSRKSEDRKDHRPQMSDLRQSGQIEQDADLAILLYREGNGKEKDEDVGLSDVIIGKQRNGPTGSVKMRFNGDYSCFDPLYPETGEAPLDNWYDK